jgi:N-acetylneuraminic acid mutarotase
MQNTRGLHTATVLPNGLVLITGGHNGAWGGNPPSKGNTGGYVSTCELYNPATNSFSYTGSLNTLRYQHTATLLPNGKVLITGGSIGYNTYTNTCEIYDPSTGNWSVTDSMSESRFMHSATLLPNGTVLVIGGLNNVGNIVSTCEIYNPSTNSWSSTGSISNPTWQHSATLLPNGKVLLAGGLHSSGQTNTCQLYNPSTGTWSNTASLQNARTEHHAILLNTGKVLVAAGNNNKSLGSCELYDPNSGTWSATASLNTVRTGCGFIKLPNGKVLIAGGNYWPSGAYVNNYINSVEVYDPAVGTWSTTANMNTARYLTVVTLLPNGKAFFTGGLLNASTHQASCEIYTDTCSAPSIPILSSSSSTNCGTQLTTINIQSGNLYNAASWQWFTSSCGGTSAGTGSSISLYPTATTTYYVRGQGGCVSSGNCANITITVNSSSPTWTNTTSLNTARYAATAHVLANGKVLIIGGSTNANNNGLKSCELYDPSNASITSAGSLNYSRYSHASVVLPNGKILVTGGYGGYYHTSCEIYDPATNSWSLTGSMNSQRYAHTITLLNNGKVLITGGHGGSNLSSCEIYDPSTGSWSYTGSLPNPVRGHTATLLSNGKVMVIGGSTTYFGYNITNTCAIYDPSTGVWTATNPMNVSRVWHASTLLNNGKVLVSGGLNSATNYFKSCEIYDPATNSWSNTGSMKSGRATTNTVILNNGHILIAGGAKASGYLDSAEVYNQNTNTWYSLPNLNTARDGLPILLNNGKVLMIGGYNGSAFINNCEIFYPGCGSTCNEPDIPTLSASSTSNCGTKSTTISITAGNLDSAKTWKWYTGSCGETLIDTGISITVYPAVTTTYYVRGEGGCAGLGTCASITINVNQSEWQTPDSMTRIRGYHTATLLSNGNVLVAGGHNEQWNYNGYGSVGGFVDPCEIYNPTTKTFSNTGSLNVKRYNQSATLLHNGKVLISGGSTKYNVFTSSSELYNPTTGSFTNTGSMHTMRFNQNTILLNTGKVLTIGGLANASNSGPVFKYLSSCELYDTASGTWSYTDSLPYQVWFATATLLNNGKILLAGGQNSNGTLKNCQIYDPSTGKWSATGSLNHARCFFTATLLPNGKVLIAGGEDGYSVATCEIYDPTTETWSNTGALNTASQGHSSYLLSNGDVILMGGINWNGQHNYLNRTEIYKVATGQWSVVDNMETKRLRHSSTLLANGDVLIIGGKSNETTFNITSEVYKVNCGNCLTPSAPTLSATYSNTCAGQSTALSIASGQLDSATHWQWYSNSCTGTSLGSGNTITVAPTTTTTYFARGNGGCVSSAPCGGITITVKPIPVITPVNDIDLQTPAGVCTYPVSFSAQASGSPSPQIKFYLQDYHSYGPFDYEIHSGDLFSPFYAIGFPTPATVNVIASNTCGSDTDQFVITLHGKRVNISCPSNDTLMLDTGETTYTDYTNGHGVIPGTHNLLDASILNHCGLGGGPYYKFSGATVSSRFTDLHSTPFNLGTTRVVAFAYDEWTGFFLDNELFGDNFNDSMLHVWADSCVFYITIVDRQANLISCVNNQTVNENFTGHTFKVTSKSFDPSFVINRSAISSITNNYNNDSTLIGAQFNIGTTRILWTATDTANHFDTCSFLLTVNPCGALTPPGINVYYGNKTISTQAQMDAFYNTSSGSNHNCKYTLLVGSLTLDGSNNSDPITNLCNLNKLTEIIGGLQILNFNRAENPVDLSDLSAVTTINCNLNISSNSKLQNATLSSVSYIGCSVNIKDNASLKIINLPALQTVKGDKLLIQNHPKLEKLWISTDASSFAFTGKGSSVDISNNGNGTSQPLSINCKKITVVNGAIVFSNNDNQGVTNFDNIFTGLTALNTKWGKLTITNNDYLNTCCIAASVTVGGSGKRHIISGNTGNCADSMAVFTSCGAFHKRNPISLTFTNQPLLLNLYPNPNQGNFDLQINTPESGNLTITITDLLGRNMYTSKFAISGDTNLPLNLINAANGQYILKATFNEQVFVKRFIINH